MLQNIRQNIQGTAAKIVVGLIVISFSIFGIESILLGGGGGGVAEVNGEEISPQELQQSVNTQKRRLIAMMGDNIDPAMLDDERLGAQVLEELIRRRLLVQSAESMDLALSEEQIGMMVSTMAQFQVDGRFSPDLYKSVLANAGYTPAYFKQSLRNDVVVSQLRSGLAASDFATPAELNLNARIIGEQRDLRYLTIPRQNFEAELDISDQDIEAYYDENQAEFLSPESVDLEYIELLAEDFREAVDEDAILAAYEEEIASVQYQTESRVSHILFEDPEDERLAQARARLAAGEDFGEVASELSDDIGSSGSGGDLGYTSGESFPSAMEEAIAALEPGVISEPVETDAGVHLLLVTDRKDGEAPDLETMRPQLEDRLQMDQARVELLRVVETLKDLSFNAEDLDSPAQELDLSVERVEGVTRSQAEGLFANASLLQAAFGEEVLQGGHNSDVIELSGDQWVVLRVRQHNEPQVRPLEEVREEIVGIITDNAARAAVSAEAERALRALRDGSSLEEVALAGGYEWQVELGVERSNTVVPPEVVQRAFQLPVPAEGESAADYVMTTTGDVRVFELARVTPGELETLPGTTQQALRQQVSAEYGTLVDAEYQSGLRARADITVM
jgi:peptidyl-prolyl cis-trans isomerase D